MAFRGTASAAAVVGLTATPSTLAVPPEYGFEKTRIDLSFADPDGDVASIRFVQTDPGGNKISWVPATIADLRGATTLTATIAFWNHQPTGNYQISARLVDLDENEVASSTVTVGFSTSASPSLSIGALPTSQFGLGDVLTIPGTGITDRTQVFIDGSPAKVLSHSASDITVVVPATSGDARISLRDDMAAIESAAWLDIRPEIRANTNGLHGAVVGSRQILPFSTVGARTLDGTWFLDGVQGGDGETGFIAGGLARFGDVPVFDFDGRPNEVTIRFEVPGDPTVGSPGDKTTIEIKQALNGRCLERGPRFLDDKSFTDLVDPTGRFVVEIRPTDLSAPTEVQIGYESNPSVSPPSGVEPLAWANLDGSPLGTMAGSARFHARLPIAVPSGVTAWFRPNDMMPWTQIPGIDVEPTVVSGEVGSFGEILVGLNRDLLPTTLFATNPISKVDVPPGLNVRSFGPSPVFDNVIKEGSTLPVRVSLNAPLPTIKEVRVRDLFIVENDPSDPTLWNLASPIPAPVGWEDSFTFGTIKQTDEAVGFTLRLEPNTELDPRDLLLVSFELVAEDQLGAEQTYATTNDEFVVFGLPELIVDDLSQGTLFTVDGIEVDATLEQDGCPAVSLCPAYEGRQAPAQCAFHDTGCYSMVEVKAGATLGVGRAIETVTYAPGDCTQNQTVDVDSLTKYEAFFGELPWVTTAQRSAGSGISVFAPFAQMVQLFVTGRVDVEEGGRIVLNGARGHSAYTKDDDTGQEIGRAGGVLNHLDSTLPSFLSGGWGGMGGLLTPPETKDNPTPGSAAGEGCVARAYPIISEVSAAGQVVTGIVDGGQISEGGDAIKEELVENSEILELFTTIKGLVTGLQSLGTESLLARFAFNLHEDPDISLPDATVAALLETLLDKDLKVEGLPDSLVEYLARTDKCEADFNINLSKFELTNPGACPAFEILNGMGDAAELAAALNDGFFLPSAGGALLGEDLSKFVQNRIGNGSGKVKRIRNLDVFGQDADLVGQGGIGGEDPEGISAEVLGSNALHTVLSGAGGFGAGGGGASVLKHTVKGLLPLPLFNDIEFTSAAKSIGSGGGGGGGAAGGLRVVSGQEIAVFGTLDGSGGQGGQGHPQKLRGGVGGGGGGGSGGNVQLQAPIVLTPDPVDVSGGEPGFGLAVMNGVPLDRYNSRIQALHGINRGHFIQFKEGEKFVLLSLPDGRVHRALDLPRPVIGVGEVFDARGGAGILTVSPDGHICRYGIPDLWTGNFVLGDPCINDNDLGTDIAAFDPDFVPHDIAQEREAPFHIFVSGWRNVQHHGNSRSADSRILEIDPETGDVLGVAHEVATWTPGGGIPSGFIGDIDILAGRRVFTTYTRDHPPNESLMFEYVVDLSGCDVEMLSPGQVCVGTEEAKGQWDHLIHYGSTLAIEPGKITEIRTSRRFSLAGYDGDSPPFSEMTYIETSTLDPDSPHAAERAAVFDTWGAPGQPGFARVDGLGHCSKPPRAVTPISRKDKAWQHTLTNPTISEVLSPTGPRAREGMLPDLVTTDSELILRVIGAGPKYLDNPETPWFDPSRTYRLVYTSSTTSWKELKEAATATDLVNLANDRVGMRVFVAQVPADGFLGVGAEGVLGGSALLVDPAVRRWLLKL